MMNMRARPPKTFADLDPVAIDRDAVCMCRWELGQEMALPAFFCGAPSVPGKPYCGAHLRMAYRPPTPEEERELSDLRGRA